VSRGEPHKIKLEGIDTMIDKRLHYLLCVDTEATNCIQEGFSISKNSLPYDIGWAIMDTHGRIYETFSFVNSDVFYEMPELMETAYYAKKLPRYHEEIACGLRTVGNTWEIRQAMLESMAKYNVREVVAHNARFDYDTLNNIVRYLTGSKVRNWFPFGMVEWWDSMAMARSVVCKMPTYKTFCTDVLELSRVSAKAENLYRFIIRDPEFVEAHTGLEDVLIESQIVAYCYRQHKAMNKRLFKEDFPEETEFQKNFRMNLREIPVISI
jgi:hypothetical protein